MNAPGEKQEEGQEKGYIDDEIRIHFILEQTKAERT